MKVCISTHSRGYISYPVHKVFVSPAHHLQWALYLHKCGKAFSSFFLLSLLQSYKPVSICTLRLRLPLPRASFSGVSFWLTFSSMMLYQQMTQVAQPSSLRYSLGITFCTSFCCVAFSPQLAPPSLPAPPSFPSPSFSCSLSAPPPLPSPLSSSSYSSSCPSEWDRYPTVILGIIGKYSTTEVHFHSQSFLKHFFLSESGFGPENQKFRTHSLTFS